MRLSRLLNPTIYLPPILHLNYILRLVDTFHVVTSFELSITPCKAKIDISILESRKPGLRGEKTSDSPKVKCLGRGRVG